MTVDFKVYGDEDGASLYCMACEREVEQVCITLRELDTAAATHYWEVHGSPLRQEVVRRLCTGLDIPREMLERSTPDWRDVSD